MPTSEVVSPLVLEMGVGIVGSVIVRYALKKLGKPIFFLIGVLITVLAYLSTQSMINVSYSGLWSALGGFIGSTGSAFSWLGSVMPFCPSQLASSSAFYSDLGLHKSPHHGDLLARAHASWKSDTFRKQHAERISSEMV